ncbi:STAS domain-containing protein [Actinoplanes sp. NPDC023714]|uniref:STAS domain-containing protein n=1 Tax=Actinoplanes sp. NPDC023714 TaxID=3154322 RepID=UPI0033D5FF52
MFVDTDYADSPLSVQLLTRTTARSVIAVAGEVDSSNSDAMQSEILGRLGETSSELVVFDLSGLVFLGSAGLRALLRCRDLAEERGSRVEISQAHENVRQVLEICGLGDLFHLPPAEPEPAEPDGRRFWAPWWR